MFEKLTDNIYIRKYQHYTDRPNIGLICGTKRSLLYDAGNSAANVLMLKKELADAGLPHPDYVALSHWHWDHSFGMHAWDVPVIAGRETDAQLRKVMEWKWDDASMQARVNAGDDIAFCTEMIKREYPDRSRIRVTGADIIFDERKTIDLGGGIICELIHAKGPHSSDSVICWVPSDRFLFLGDSNCKDLYGQTWHFDIDHEENFTSAVAALKYDRDLVEAYLRLLDKLDFTDCISGHSDPQSRDALYCSLRE